jgi:anti-sigma regulatory factor (Ser/Thr protein kinase)
MEVLSESFPARPTAIRAARHRAAAYALDHGATDRLAATIALAVSEALTNAVLHAGLDQSANGIELRLACEPAGLSVVVRDEGRGLRPRIDSPGAGFGLPIIAGLADRLEILHPDGGGTELRMLFKLTG